MNVIQSMNKAAGVVDVASKEITELDKFVPLWSYCLIQPLPQDKTKGGIILPDGSKHDDVHRSLVVKAGPGEHRTCDGVWVENPIKVGDVIYHLSRGTITKVVLEGKLYLYVSGVDVIARQAREEELAIDKTIPPSSKKPSNSLHSY